jgi:hypothetical protein
MPLVKQTVAELLAHPAEVTNQEESKCPTLTDDVAERLAGTTVAFQVSCR